MSRKRIFLSTSFVFLLVCLLASLNFTPAQSSQIDFYVEGTEMERGERELKTTVVYSVTPPEQFVEGYYPVNLAIPEGINVTDGNIQFIHITNVTEIEKELTWNLVIPDNFTLGDYLCCVTASFRHSGGLELLTALFVISIIDLDIWDKIGDFWDYVKPLIYLLNAFMLIVISYLYYHRKKEIEELREEIKSK